MVVLSYDSAKRFLLMMVLYLVCASLIIKGIGHLLEYNFISAFQSMLGGKSISFSLPEFNMDSLSFEWLANTFKEKVEEIITVIIPSTLGIANYAQISQAVAANKAVIAGTTKVALKA